MSQTATRDLPKTVDPAYLRDLEYSGTFLNPPPYWPSQSGPGVLITMDSGEEWFHSHRGGKPHKITERTRHLVSRQQ